MILIDAERLAASRPNRPLFADVSVTISDGDRLGVVGLNGCGKSTLLRMMNRQERPAVYPARRQTAPAAPPPPPADPRRRC